MAPIKQFSGTVIEGEKVGRKLGFPTINIEGQYDLPFGVYASLVHTPLGTYKGALHYGPRKIFGIEKPCLEVYLLDFEGDLYGESVTVEVYNKVRDTMRFSDVASLKKQIADDVEQIRNTPLEPTT